MKTFLLIILLIFSCHWLHGMDAGPSSGIGVVGVSIDDQVDHRCPVCCEPFTSESCYTLAERLKSNFCDSSDDPGEIVWRKECGHSICKKCLQLMIEQAEQCEDVVRCPLCRSCMLNRDLNNFRNVPLAVQNADGAALLFDLKKNDYVAVAYLLNHGTTLWCRDNEGKMPLYVAVQKNDAKLVCDLLCSIPLDELYNYLQLGTLTEKETALMLAARLGFTDIIEIILSILPPDKRFEHAVETRTEYGEFALFKAVEYNKIDAVKKILSMIPEALREEALTACCWNKNVIHKAIENGYFKMLQTLLLFVREEQRVRVLNIPVASCLAFDNQGMNALHLAVKSKSVNATPIITFLIAHGADLNACDAKGHKPFDLAETDEMRALLHY